MNRKSFEISVFGKHTHELEMILTDNKFKLKDAKFDPREDVLCKILLQTLTHCSANLIFVNSLLLHFLWNFLNMSTL